MVEMWQSETTGQTEARSGELVRLLVEAFKPAHLKEEYRVEMAGKRMPLPEPMDDSTMITFTASDGHLSLRPLTFGEIADRVLAAGYVRVRDDDETVRRVANAMAEMDGWSVTWPAKGEELEELHYRYLSLAREAIGTLRALAALGGGEQ